VALLTGGAFLYNRNMRGPDGIPPGTWSNPSK